VASVEYRLLPKYRWPAQIEDVKCAVRYLRAHAKELNIDPSEIGAIGDSAGGHLVLLLGLMDPKDDLEGNGGSPGLSSKVQAVVNLFGPTDLRVWRALPEGEPGMEKEFGKNSEQLLADLVGTSDRAAPVVLQASPVNYIDKADPPILTFHGTKDPIVPFEQAKLLHSALEKAGVRQKLVPIQDAGHGWQGPQLIDTVRQGLEFFDSVLKPAR
jgi:acetyl esterase/lipase